MPMCSPAGDMHNNCLYRFLQVSTSSNISGMQGTVQFVTAGGSGLVTTASSVHSLSQPVTVSVSQMGLNQNVSNSDDIPQLSQLDGAVFSDSDSDMCSEPEVTSLPQLDGVSDSEEDNGEESVSNQLNLGSSETKTEENKDETESKQQSDEKDEKGTEEKDDMKPDTDDGTAAESSAVREDSINEESKRKENYDDDELLKNEPKEETEDEEEQMIQKDNITDDAVSY